MLGNTSVGTLFSDKLTRHINTVNTIKETSQEERIMFYQQMYQSKRRRQVHHAVIMPLEYTRPDNTPSPGSSLSW
jgi:hypothetical protein